MEEIISGNWIIVGILTVINIMYILGDARKYCYFTNKGNSNAAELLTITTRISELELRLSAIFEADEENARNDRELAAKVSDIADMVEEMYTPITGKTHENTEE